MAATPISSAQQLEKREAGREAEGFTVEHAVHPDPLHAQLIDSELEMLLPVGAGAEVGVAGAEAPLPVVREGGAGAPRSSVSSAAVGPEGQRAPQQRVEWLRQGLWPAGQLAAALPAAASTRAPSIIGPARGRRSGSQSESAAGGGICRKHERIVWKKIGRGSRHMLG